MSDLLFWFLIAPGLFAFYVYPAVLAYRRGYPQWRGLLVLTVLIGWTPVGCAIAWIWFWRQRREARTAQAL